MLFSAFFSGMEIAFVSSNKLHIELERSKGLWSARLLSRFLDNPSSFIATMLVGNNIALVVYGLQMGGLLEPMLREHIGSGFLILLIQTIISTLLVLVTAEFLPKAVFNLYANRLLKVFSFPVSLLYLLLFPVVWIFTGISNQILRLLGQSIGDEKTIFARIDLENYLDEHTSGIPASEEVETEIQILQNALDFTKVKARECMIHRTEIVAMDVNDSIDELHAEFVETGYSKILIYEENIDHVIGFTHSFELFKRPKNIREILIPIATIPESMLANDILNLLTKERKSIAVVIDEFGGTSGLICLEDIIEEIFGEIEDEHDSVDLLERKIGENEYLFSARLEIDHLNETYKLKLKVSDEYETLGGLLLHHLEDIPSENKKIRIGNHRFTIVKAHQTRLEEIKMSVNYYVE